MGGGVSPCPISHPLPSEGKWPPEVTQGGPIELRRLLDRSGAPPFGGVVELRPRAAHQVGHAARMPRLEAVVLLALGRAGIGGSVGPITRSSDRRNPPTRIRDNCDRRKAGWPGNRCVPYVSRHGPPEVGHQRSPSISKSAGHRPFRTDSCYSPNRSDQTYDPNHLKSFARSDDIRLVAGSIAG